MRDILNDVEKWIASGEDVSLATVIQTWGSSPRRVGAKMALTQDGKITGSVSGGCVESAVFEAGVEVLQSRQPQLLKFGVADETAWQVGLACGGKIEVFVQPLEPDFFDLQRKKLVSNKSYCIASLISGPAGLTGREMLVENKNVQGSLGSGLDDVGVEKARAALAEGRSQSIDLDWKGEPVRLFLEVVKPAPTLVMVGGVHIAIALNSLAKTLDFQTLVIDPRRAFGSAQRFPDVGQLIQAWPDDAFEKIEINEGTAVVMLTHDPKIDDPALKIVLNSPAFYVGALGSRNTHEKRKKRLMADGVTSSQLDRIHAPIGMEIGAETPEEIALAIMAEIVAARHQV
jgi:xanthine dehydrogenase accessory factor